MIEGASLPLGGEPREIGGHGRDRDVYAPVARVFRTRTRIGDGLREGHTIATIGAMALPAPFDGAVRGLTRDGVPVRVRTKIIEVDRVVGPPMSMESVSALAGSATASSTQYVSGNAADEGPR